MENKKSQRGFSFIIHKVYPPKNDSSGEPVKRAILRASSAIDMEVEGGFENPGSSFLWIDENFHVNRKEAIQIADAIRNWLETGKLEV